ncbi:hypothetical protein BGX21_003030 [Mortierella sp. AD011]|nr:hypothetical protein BGX20_004165 [Mortierella sp. AD010]KAF9403535.1 hypothetical protein BGX21_003030 [Mortierella sp. AD011]
MIRLAIMSSKIDAGLSQLSSDAKLRVTTTMQAKRLLRGQWRPALMMGSVMTLLTVFWLFYFVDAHRIADANFTTPWIQQWLVCVYTNAGMGKSSTETQSICAKTIKSNLPSVPWFTAAEVLLAVIGIVVAGIFITKLEFWEEWRDMLSNLFNTDSSSSGRSSPDRDDWSAPRRTKSFDDGMNMNTSTFNSSKVQLNEAPGAQWYDMDDLLDKEYDDQGNRVLQSASYGSPKNMTTHSVSSPISEPPRYNSGDLLYKANASAHSATSASNPTSPSSPTGAYIELPVVPTPVPRTPKMNSREHVYLSNSAPNSGSIPSPLPLPPVSPTIYSQGGSLSPMPPRSPQQQYRQRQQRSNPLESVPIIAVATRGSVTQAYQRSSQPSSPSSSSSQKQRTNLYNSYESGERIQAPSHGGAAGSSAKSSPNTSMRINTAVADAGTAMDSRVMSPPPSKPNKSPRRQNQPVYMSPPINVPTSPNSDSNYH